MINNVHQSEEYVYAKGISSIPIWNYRDINVSVDQAVFTKTKK